MGLADDDLRLFEAEGVALPAGGDDGFVDHDGARLWFASFGAGPPVVLLHGGLGHSGNFGHQIAALIGAGYRAVAIDSRGHGRSTRDDRPFSYSLMAADVRAVMDRLGVERAAFVGWSDGACTALVLAHDTLDRAAGVLFFACNVDPGGTKPFVGTPVIDRCFSRHQKDFAALSPAPDGFNALLEALGPMQRTQPNYAAADLRAIAVPVTVVHAEHDEFIRPGHARYIAAAIPGAALVELDGVSHFAPLQRPDRFNSAMLAFLGALPA